MHWLAILRGDDLQRSLEIGQSRGGTIKGELEDISIRNLDFTSRGQLGGPTFLQRQVPSIADVNHDFRLRNTGCDSIAHAAPRRLV